MYKLNRVYHDCTIRKNMIVLFWDRESNFFITHPYLTLPKQPKNGAIFGVIYPWLSKTNPEIKIWATVRGAYFYPESIGATRFYIFKKLQTQDVGSCRGTDPYL